MCRAKWKDYVYKCVSMVLFMGFVGPWLSPGVGASTNIPQYTFNWAKDRFSPGGAKLEVPIGSNFRIICPMVNNSEPEYYAIYWVSEEGFNSCFLPNEDRQILVICNKPYQPFDFTVEITIFSGTPGAKDFEIGKSYYIASFSTGTKNGLLNEYHGVCQAAHMKINLTVVDQQLPTTAAPNPSPQANTTTSTTRTTTPEPTTTPRPTTPRPTFTPRPTTASPQYSTDIPSTRNTDNTINVPDNGNTGVIDITNSARTPRAHNVVLLTFALSLLHILYHRMAFLQDIHFLDIRR